MQELGKEGRDGLGEERERGVGGLWGTREDLELHCLLPALHPFSSSV